MHANYLYLLYWAESVSLNQPTATILDYGCGSGNVVLEGRKRNLNIYGTEIFFSQSDRQNVEKSGLLGEIIRESKNNRLDFADEYFDLVLNNQVFEHIRNVDTALAEISRVMKKDAILVCLFPTGEVIREGHIGIPFAHWFSRNSPVRYYYTLCLRSLGFGFFKQGLSKAQWTKEKLDWIDNYAFYRKRKDILKHFLKYFEIGLVEDDYIKFRLSANRKMAWLSPLLKFPLVKKISQLLFHRLVGVVILAKKIKKSEKNLDKIKGLC